MSEKTVTVTLGARTWRAMLLAFGSVVSDDAREKRAWENAALREIRAFSKDDLATSLRLLETALQRTLPERVPRWTVELRGGRWELMEGLAHRGWYKTKAEAEDARDELIGSYVRPLGAC